MILKWGWSHEKGVKFRKLRVKSLTKQNYWDFWVWQDLNLRQSMFDGKFLTPSIARLFWSLIEANNNVLHLRDFNSDWSPMKEVQYSIKNTDQTGT